MKWGTRLCQFYERPEEMLRVVSSFLRAGLRNHEMCVWILPPSLTPQDAATALREVIPDLSEQIAGNAVAFLPAPGNDGDGAISWSEWQRLVGNTVAAAADRGFAALRGCGAVNLLQGAVSAAGDLPAVFLSTCCLPELTLDDVSRVLRAHDLALATHPDTSGHLLPRRIAGGTTSRESGDDVVAAGQDMESLRQRLHAEVAARQRAQATIEELRRALEDAGATQHPGEHLAFSDIAAHSPMLEDALRQVHLVAGTNAAVLIIGEAGSGKELVARAIHRRSARSDRPLIAVNCAAVPRQLFESEVFGQAGAAFTGAVRDRVGRFQIAHRGTIFLDEVGEIPPELQSRLLRVLQEGRIEPPGDSGVHHVDVRLIAASRHDLNQEVESGRFRRDLFYRLSVFPIHLPALRHRLEDIGLLSAHLLKVTTERLSIRDVWLDDRGLEQLRAYDWPGNIRELNHVIERALVLTQRGPLRIDLVLGDRHSGRAGYDAMPVRRRASDRAVLSESEIERRDRINILAALEKSHWKIYGRGGAAEILGIRPTTLASRMKRFAIVRPH